MWSTRQWRRMVWLLVAVASAPLVAAGCSGGDDFDRQAAIDEMMTTGAAPGPSEAACFVDRVVDDLGTDAVADPTGLDLDGYRQLTVIRIDCLGPASLGSPRPGAAADVLEPAVGTVVRNAPFTLGDDDELDALWAACESGAGAACDELFDLAPLGSDYERFAVSCGGRGAEASCAVAYPGDAG